ncbi:MAG: hypothetical protein QNJ72_13665 [Pleurocapsa sp. MO_226.B13]|nr:hypothetical protein [Pleurocapsa sp. MO_226.B13]
MLKFCKSLATLIANLDKIGETSEIILVNEQLIQQTIQLNEHNQKLTQKNKQLLQDKRILAQKNMSLIRENSRLSQNLRVALNNLQQLQNYIELHGLSEETNELKDLDNIITSDTSKVEKFIKEFN